MICLVADVEEIVLPPVRATHSPWLGEAVIAALGVGVAIASAVLVLMALRSRRKHRDEQ
jgi:hypothetical protein